MATADAPDRKRQSFEDAMNAEGFLGVFGTSRMESTLARTQKRANGDPVKPNQSLEQPVHPDKERLDSLRDAFRIRVINSSRRSS